MVNSDQSIDDFYQLLFELQQASGDPSNWGWLDYNTISSRDGDCCIRRHHDGWEYAKNGQRHESPVKAWQAATGRNFPVQISDNGG